jgi:hypothetical protein
MLNRPSTEFNDATSERITILVVAASVSQAARLVAAACPLDWDALPGCWHDLAATLELASIRQWHIDFCHPASPAPKP